MKVYNVPKEIAIKLKMTEYRMQREEDGRFLLSADDLVPYGIEKAIADGALETTVDNFTNNK
jgi:hypothetical protein